MTSKDPLQAAVGNITADTGYVKLLGANSGLVGPYNAGGTGKSIQDLRRTMFTELSMEDFTETFRVNVTGAFFTIGAFFELLDAGNHTALQVDGFGGPVAPGVAVPAIQSQVVVTSSIAAFIR